MGVVRLLLVYLNKPVLIYFVIFPLIRSLTFGAFLYLFIKVVDCSSVSAYVYALLDNGVHCLNSTYARMVIGHN